MRICIETRKDVNANVLLKQLFKHTQLQDTFGVIMLALVDNQPKVLNLKEMLVHYLNHQKGFEGEGVLRTADGEELYSSYERGDTVRSLVRNLRRGVQESVKLIGKGGKINAWMPSSAAYGAEGDKELGVAPNATLYFEIELVDLDKYTTRSRRR